MSGKSLPANALQETKVLVVDDEDVLAWGIDTELKALGAEVTRAGTVREAIERFNQFHPDIAITDLRLPDGNGLELLKKWRHEHPEVPVILITAHGAIDSAITAVRLGAFDYLQKPFDMKSLIAAVTRATEVSQLRKKVQGLQGMEKPREEVEIIGTSPAMDDLRERLKRLAKSKASTALILGESGTGKELAARALHQWSDRSAQPFIEINCASIPETLLESELFGYEKGAFTDARDRKLGLFEMARNGTIFLDEIGEMPLKLQSKLLRALEYRRFKRLGGTKDIEFSARIVAATNRDLLAEVAAGNFRGDLLYRLNALPVMIPSLRERREDIPALTDFFVAGLANELGITKPKVADATYDLLSGYSWPGNIRELKNVLTRALIFHEPKTLEPGHVEFDAGFTATPGERPTPVKLVPPISAATPLARPSTPQAESKATNNDDRFQLPDSGINLEDLERKLLVQALEKARNNQTRAAALLGISRHALRYRMEKHGLATDANSH